MAVSSSRVPSLDRGGSSMRSAELSRPRSASSVRTASRPSRSSGRTETMTVAWLRCRRPCARKRQQLQAGAVDPLHVFEDEDASDAQPRHARRPAGRPRRVGADRGRRCRPRWPRHCARPLVGAASSGRSRASSARADPRMPGEHRRRHLSDEVAEQLGEGQVGDGRPEREALTAEDSQWRTRPPEAVVDEPGLADAGLAADDDDTRVTVEQRCQRAGKPAETQARARPARGWRGCRRRPPPWCDSAPRRGATARCLGGPSGIGGRSRLPQRHDQRVLVEVRRRTSRVSSRMDTDEDDRR